MSMNVKCPHCPAQINILAFSNHLATCQKKYLAERLGAMAAKPKESTPMRVEDAERCLYCRHLVRKEEMPSHMRGCRKEPQKETTTVTGRQRCGVGHDFEAGRSSIVSADGKLYCLSHLKYAFPNEVRCAAGHTIDSGIRAWKCSVNGEHFCSSHMHIGPCCTNVAEPGKTCRICDGNVAACCVRYGTNSPAFFCKDHSHKHAGLLMACCTAVGGPPAPPEPQERVYTRDAGPDRCWCRLAGDYVCAKQGGPVCAVHVHRDLEAGAKTLLSCCKERAERKIITEVPKDKSGRVLPFVKVAGEDDTPTA